MYINVVKKQVNMKFAHSITITVFIKEDEDKELAKQKLQSLIPETIEKEKLKIEEQTATGLNDKKIAILKITIEKENHTKKFIENLLTKLGPEQKDTLIKQLDTRIDEECNFYIRLDKEQLSEDKYSLTDSGNCYHIKIVIAAYPAKKDSAIQAALQMLAQKRNF